MEDFQWKSGFYPWKRSDKRSPAEQRQIAKDSPTSWCKILILWQELKISFRRVSVAN
jgi:hypothetical protein